MVGKIFVIISTNGDLLTNPMRSHHPYNRLASLQDKGKCLNVLPNSASFNSL
jgi:hypothetical protein